MELNDKIKQIRIKSLLSQEDFAKNLNVSFCTVNRWENNRATPNYKALKALKRFSKENDILFDIDISVQEEEWKKTASWIITSG